MAQPALMGQINSQSVGWVKLYHPQALCEVMFIAGALL